MVQTPYARVPGDSVWMCEKTCSSRASRDFPYWWRVSGFR